MLEPDGTIRFVSPAVRELGYFDPADLIGLNAAVLIHPADREKTSAVHVQAPRRPSGSIGKRGGDMNDAKRSRPLSPSCAGR